MTSRSFRGAAAPRSSTRFAVVVAALVGTLALAACGSGSSSDDATKANGDAATPKRGGVLRISAVDPGAAVDPVTVASAAGGAIVGPVVEQLTKLDAAGAVEPVLAERWSPSKDGLRWTFHLRDGVTFQDGQPLTSADVVASYERVVGKDSTSPGKSAFDGVLDQVSAPDADTVEFRLKRPFSDFPVLTTGANTYILPKDYKPGTWEENPVGTGPFVLDRYKPGQSVRYVANRRYWDTEHLFLGGLEIKLYKDQQARVLSLQSGETDALVGEPVDTALTAALDGKRFARKRVPNAGFTAFTLRVDRAPFDDVDVRRAIAWALDREAVVKTVLGGAGFVGNDTIYSPTYETKPKGIEQRQANPDKVKELLAGRKVAFTITTTSASETLATLIQQQLNAIDGFDVKIDVLPPNEYYGEGATAPWLSAPATLTFWAHRPSPSQLNDFLYRRASDWNASRYANPRLEALSRRYDATSDASERQGIVDELARIEWDEVPVIVPAFVQNESFSAPNVHGIEPPGPGVIDWTGVWIG